MVTHKRIFVFLFLIFTLNTVESFAQTKGNYFAERFEKPYTPANYKNWNTHCNYSIGKDSNLHITYLKDRSQKSQVLRFSYKLLKKDYDYSPYATLSYAIGAEVFAGESLEGIAYHFKGHEHFFTYLTHAGNDYYCFRKKIPASSKWTKVIIPFSELKQDGGSKIEFNYFNLSGFTWLIRGLDQDTGSIYLDNICLIRSRNTVNAISERFSPIIKSDSSTSKILNPNHDILFGKLEEYNNVSTNYIKYSEAILRCEKLIDSLINNLDKTTLNSKEKKTLQALLELSINQIPQDAILKLKNQKYRWKEIFSSIIPYDTLCKIDRNYLGWISYTKASAAMIKDWWQFASADKRDYPSYTVKNDTCFKKEIELFNFQSYDTIAEIGSGNAFFEKALSINNDDLTVYVNDIDSACMAKLAVKLGLLQLYDRKNINYIPILGTAKNSNIPAGAIDKLIIRNTFHHFTHPTEMVDNFKKVLQKEGSIFIIDKLMDEAKHIDCPLYMKRENFMNYFTQNGFTLVKETLVYEEYKCFEFKLMP